ncbi:hypothetical protein [Pontibacter mangrovi]|uniref:Lipoprotein n=1 Tax=Pontibacter mangrovi TaxID=2589816 RepID=A0A501W4S2_9BACT|nr:hypothetical protein [Pontibacter mangrovi]TPE43290.1 hypothetical protein FJM65_14360 [Pontibacter mangrovi]
MKNILIKILAVFFISFIVSCSTNRELIQKEKTDFGTVKYYVETGLKDNRHQKRIVAKVDNAIYYSFYSAEIVKHTNQNKELIYRLFYGEIPEELNDPKYFQKLTKLDSVVLSGSDRVLDSLKWKNFKSWNGASAFEIEVNYYHVFPKNEKIKPY